MRDKGEALRTALGRVWVEELPTGYCLAEVRPVGAEYALLVDSGLPSTLHLGARLLAQHFPQGLLAPGSVPQDVRRSFGRLFAAYLGQYYLFGRFRRAPGLALDSHEEAWARALTTEAVAFVLAHELGHVMAGHRPGDASPRWLDPSQLGVLTLPAAEELEADAVAVQLLLGDLRGSRVDQGVVDLRLTAMRLVFEALSAVELCYLVPPSSRHLPAGRRWAGVQTFLRERFPESLLHAHDRDWAVLAAALSFGPVDEPLPPETPLHLDLHSAGWDVDWSGGQRAAWADGELAAWQYRLRPLLQRFLVGTEAMHLTVVSHADVAAVLKAGEAVLAEVLAKLPPHLAGAGSGRVGHAGVADLVVHLRQRGRWPEPFRSDDSLVLPLHLVAAAIAAQLVRSSVAGPADQPQGGAEQADV